MQRTSGLFPIFAFLFCLSLFLLLLSKFGDANGLGGIVQDVVNPVDHLLFTSVYGATPSTLSPMDRLTDANNVLLSELAQEKELEMDNQALRDQFQTASPNSQNLVPAKIIGFSGFIPGLTPINAFIVNIGTDNQVMAGEAVVFKNNLIGIVSHTSEHLSVISPITSNNVSITAQTVNTQALGIIQGDNNVQIDFDNVILSDTLSVNDVVVTKGDINGQGFGIPPGLVVGKIVSIDKKTSALFQSAKLESLIDLTHLSTVFILNTR